ncbi:MAG: GTP 3',8-cyclase MoaA [Planctomycetota bacterium]|jgi:cyclic pyranopterin phosphate synthase
MSAFDRYDRRIDHLRISVTDRCNLRCVYCIPPGGVEFIPHEEILSFEEIYEVARAAIEMGIDKIRITGGEPLMRKDIPKLVKMLAGIDGIKDLAMTTNGVLLAEFALELKLSGLRRVNVSLDAMDPDRYRLITRGGELQCVLAGIDAAVAADLRPLKLNCVIERSPDEPDARSVAAFAEEKKLEARFIRRMDLAAGRFWKVEGGRGGHCSRCNRLRLSSNGTIRPCLFSDLGFSVREFGARGAIEMAINSKPLSGKTARTTGLYAIGG